MKMRYSPHPVKTFFRVSFLAAVKASLRFGGATNVKCVTFIRQDVFSSFFSLPSKRCASFRQGDEH